MKLMAREMVGSGLEVGARGAPQDAGVSQNRSNRGQQEKEDGKGKMLGGRRSSHAWTKNKVSQVVFLACHRSSTSVRAGGPG